MRIAADFRERSVGGLRSVPRAVLATFGPADRALSRRWSASRRRKTAGAVVVAAVAFGGLAGLVASRLEAGPSSPGVGPASGERAAGAGASEAGSAGAGSAGMGVEPATRAELRTMVSSGRL